MKREAWWYPVPKGMDRLGIASLRLRFSRTLKGRLQAFRRL